MLSNCLCPLFLFIFPLPWITSSSPSTFTLLTTICELTEVHRSGLVRYPIVSLDKQLRAAHVTSLLKFTTPHFLLPYRYPTSLYTYPEAVCYACVKIDLWEYKVFLSEHPTSTNLYADPRNPDGRVKKKYPPHVKSIIIGQHPGLPLSSIRQKLIGGFWRDQDWSVELLQFRGLSKSQSNSRQQIAY